MDTNLGVQERDKQERRQRTRIRWTLGLVLIGGNSCGLMFDSDALWAALHHRHYAYGTHSPYSTLGLWLGEFVLPLLIVSLAPRKSFLWAAAALGIDLAWSLMDRVVALNGPGLIRDLVRNGRDDLAALLIFCGPISLIRFLVQRGRDSRAQRIAEQQDWTRQAAEMQVGVWPPPIKTEGHLD